MSRSLCRANGNGKRHGINEFGTTNSIPPNAKYFALKWSRSLKSDHVYFSVLQLGLLRTNGNLSDDIISPLFASSPLVCSWPW